MREDPDRMEREAFDLSRLTLAVETSEAHPEGVCTLAYMRCAGCGLLAPIAVKYGGPMADCRLCGSAWTVHHDPLQCWRRSRFLDCGPGEEALADRLAQMAPLLLAARVKLGDIADTL
ncbi:hypothetical protein J7E97_11620 [Streptomyces sp. ISL-66]|uniref:hypothetical protein n=1 Tax=Streptomyces sp. ISL-66 TaxID=2819186 RepID=UPI001BE5A681|nr:hypothetical protein [Streptomyces sp. ISL-66]MBT2468509.1 hypothetical protein [Streptomyces sp. ISL-66]